MIRIRTAFAGLLAIGLLSVSARADLLTITVQEGAGAVQTFTDTGSLTGAGLVAGSLSVTTANYSITFLGGAANQNGGSSVVNSSTTTITEFSSNAGLLKITVTASGFTGPSASTVVTSSIGGSVTHDFGHNDSVSFTSAVNGTNLAAQTFTNMSAGSYNNTITPTVSSLPSTYSMAETIQVQLHTVGDSVNYSSSTQLTQTSTPEPSTMAIAGLGALGMIGYGLRRRKAKGA
jgi:hypothetical protein